jgi:putative RecB family exonuclease
MSKKQALQSFNQELHISYSQIFCFTTCPLKHRFQYVEARPPERISIVLPFGSAIHSAIEMYYLSLKNHGRTEPLEAMCERFDTCLELDLENSVVPVIFKKDLPDHKGAVEMGNAMLKVFHETIAQIVQNVQEIVAVELPLSATLYTDEGQPTEFKLSGILDLVIKDKNGEIIVVDNKTASKPMPQSTADDSGQMTAYSYLLAANRYVFPTSPVKCQFDILRKLVTPKREIVQTVRTAQDRKRFAKVANRVLAAIENGMVYPQSSWMCSDCAYSNACKAW